jgi:hypothetical protein
MPPIAHATFKPGASQWSSVTRKRENLEDVCQTTREQLEFEA